MALARALAVEPKVLLLDEPFGALDARVRKELRAWLRRLHDEVHVTTVLVTHDQEEAMDVADRVTVMNEGRIEQSGKPRDLYEHPANEFVMSFVGPVNRLGEEWIRPHDLELRLEPNGTTSEAMIQRIVHLGFEVRVELVLDDGRHVSAQVTRAEVEELELLEGQIIYVRPSRTTVFSVRGSRRLPLVRLPCPRLRRDLGDRRRELARGDVGERQLLEHGAQVRPHARSRRPEAWRPGRRTRRSRAATPRTLASGPSTARITSASLISSGGRASQ